VTWNVLDSSSVHIFDILLITEHYFHLFTLMHLHVKSIVQVFLRFLSRVFYNAINSLDKISYLTS